MIFHSFDFLALLAVTLGLYCVLPHRGQNILLLVASYVFYGWVHPWFLILVFVSTITDYGSAIGMERWPDRKKWFLGTSLVLQLGLLGFFKYFNFFVENVSAILAALGLGTSHPALAIFLPVGISFYTFQTLSYTIDVYRGQLAARHNFLDFALFVSFLPQLVAGPIERAAHMLPQVEQNRPPLTATMARSALMLMCWGFFKKLVIADNVGVIANKIFTIKDAGFELVWVGAFAFGMQIYADFSAYTDIARGTARLFGFELMRNFDHPYMARNPVDFWRRWHISLSSWFRDYVYIPLGGSRGGPVRQARNVLITFFLSGLWHGASWNYVIWGVYHGLLVVSSRALPIFRPARGRFAGLATAAQIVLMFVLVTVGWLMFRETDFDYLVRAFTLSPFASTTVDRQTALYMFLLALTWSLPLWVHSFWVEYQRARLAQEAARSTATPSTSPRRPVVRLRPAVQIALASAMVFGILMLRSRTSLDFIYFQF